MRLQKRSDRKGHRVRSFTGRLQEVLDVPPECLSSESTVEIIGDSAVIVNGCAGVYLYTEDMVRLRFEKDTVTIYGKYLEMESLIGDRVTVHGQIKSVFLKDPEEEEAKK